nr:MAG TPA: hypothetical protein [Caudoviricetes sp.]
MYITKTCRSQYLDVSLFFYSHKNSTSYYVAVERNKI